MYTGADLGGGSTWFVRAPLLLACSAAIFKSWLVLYYHLPIAPVYLMLHQYIYSGTVGSAVYAVCQAVVTSTKSSTVEHSRDLPSNDPLPNDKNVLQIEY